MSSPFLSVLFFSASLSAAPSPLAGPLSHAVGGGGTPAPMGGGDTADGKGGFSPTVFKFEVDVADDGKGVAGGWQKAKATLNFFDWRKLLPSFWTCRVTVGMGLRTELNGKIDADQAAKMTAKIATQASKTVMHRQADWPVAQLYCNSFIKEMQTMFDYDKRYSGTGAKVTQ